MNQRLIQSFINELEYDNLFDYINAYICLGHMDAVCLMGDLYYYGIGVDDDLEIAKEYYNKAAKVGHVLAKDRLGEIYYDKAEYLYSYAVSTLNSHLDKGKSILEYAVSTMFSLPTHLTCMCNILPQSMQQEITPYI